VSMPTGQTGGQTDGRQTVTLRFPLDVDNTFQFYDPLNSKFATAVHRVLSFGDPVQPRVTREKKDAETKTEYRRPI